MTFSILFLLLFAILVLVLGIVAVATVTGVAKKGRKRPDNKKEGGINEVDPWIEAGKRSKNEET